MVPVSGIPIPRNCKFYFVAAFILFLFEDRYGFESDIKENTRGKSFADERRTRNRYHGPDIASVIAPINEVCYSHVVELSAYAFVAPSCSEGQW